jgi:cell division protease FtsH
MTTGASNDIEKATEVARMMVIEYGMSSLGPINLDTDRQSMYDVRNLSPEMQSKVDAEVKRIVDECYKEAVKILTSLRKKMDLLATELLKKETLELDEFATLIGPKEKRISPFLSKSV